MSKITHEVYDAGNALLFYEGEPVAEIDAGGKVAITDESKKTLKGVLSTYCKRNKLGEYAEVKQSVQAEDDASAEAQSVDTGEASLEELAEQSQAISAAKAKEDANIPPEPKKDKVLGCRTPEWRSWCAKYKPEVYKLTGLPVPLAE